MKTDDSPNIYELNDNGTTPAVATGVAANSPAPRFMAPVDLPDISEPRDSPTHRGVKLLVRTIGLFVALTAIWSGFQLRHQLFERTASIHRRDAAMSLDWGRRIVFSKGVDGAPVIAWRPFFASYFTLYRDVRREHPEGNYGLDLPPLRLLAVGLWVRGETLLGHLDPAHPQWNASWSLNAPMLLIGATCEFAAAVLMFFLVRLWVARGQHEVPPTGPRSENPWLCGLAAGLLLWFNPALLLDSAAWPQTEGWIIPFFLGSLLLASLECWTWAGVCIGVGIMLKAQLLFVAPLLLLWPIFAGRPLSALRALGGFTAACLVILAPWLLQRTSAWWSIAFAYGLRADPVMSIDASNLPAVLASKAWNWAIGDVVWTLRVTRWHIDWPLRMKPLLVVIYSITLTLCAWGVARKSRRNDPGILISFVAPWILLVTLLPQMHGRYLAWGASLGAALAGVSLGMTLIHLLITALAMVMILRPLLAVDPSFMPKLAFDLSGLHPHIGWALAMCALIFLIEATFNAGSRSRGRWRLALPIVSAQSTLHLHPAPRVSSSGGLTDDVASSTGSS